MRKKRENAGDMVGKWVCLRNSESFGWEFGMVVVAAGVVR